MVVGGRVDETRFKRGKLHLPLPRAHLESINSSLASIVTNRPSSMTFSISESSDPPASISIFAPRFNSGWDDSTNN